MTASVRRLRRVRTKAIPSYLVVAKSADLDDVQVTLAVLPICAHGRVIVVAEPGERVPVLQLPARMSVTVRFRNDEEDAALVARQSVQAWASEMLCGIERNVDEPQSPSVIAWVAGSDSAFVNDLSQVLCDSYGLPSSSLRTGAALGAH
jgi:hypothetical protein